MGSINIKFFLMCLIYLIGFSLLVSFIIAEMSMGSIGAINGSVTFEGMPQPSQPNPLFFGIGGQYLVGANNTTVFIGYIMSLMGQIIFWSLPEALFPLWANLLFIKTVVISLVVQLIWGLIP